MDFTHPAGRLHLSRASLHLLDLELLQGTRTTLTFHMQHVHLGAKINKHLSLQRYSCQHQSAAFTVIIIHCVVKSGAKLNSSASRVSTEELHLSPRFGILFSYCCNLLLPVQLHFFPLLLFFLQTLHIYCAHTSHSDLVSSPSSNSYGLNVGECSSLYRHLWVLIPAGTAPRL